MDSDITNNQPKRHDAPSAPPLPRGALPEDILRRQQHADSIPASNTPVSKPAEPDVVEPDSGPKFPYVKPASKEPRIKRLFKGYWRRKLWTLPLTVLVILGIVMAVPQTRYPILALGLKRQFTVTVTDSKTHTPVSGVSVTLGSATATTDASGTATLSSPVGQHELIIKKKYYQDSDRQVFVGIIASRGNAAQITLDAIGRQVPLKAVNKITGKPVADAEISVLGTKAKTDADGTVTIVLPTNLPKQTVTVAAAGYNNLAASVEVTSSVVGANTLQLVPAGRVYFLSNLNGKIDVVSTDLGGGSRQTVLAGTGSEDANATLLLASRDWKYLALLSKRDSNNAKLYLISTASGQLTTIDGSPDIFTPIGWSGHYFIYKASDTSLQNWQPGGTVIKSYNADTAKPVTLASTTATGTSNADAQYQNIWDAAFVGGNLVYDVTWYAYPGNLAVTGQQDTLMSVKPDGTGSKTLKSVDASQYYISNFMAASPVQAYFGVYSSTSSTTNYYRLDSNGSVTQSSTITSDSVEKNYPTYLLSPSGNATFWGEQRDGKNTLFTGDSTGGSATQVVTLSDYTAYGWYTDSYLLVQKGGSELYIMPPSGGTPFKISDYYKPQYGLYGFDGSYGGL